MLYLSTSSAMWAWQWKGMIFHTDRIISSILFPWSIYRYFSSAELVKSNVMLMLYPYSMWRIQLPHSWIIPKMKLALNLSALYLVTVLVTWIHYQHIQHQRYFCFLFCADLIPESIFFCFWVLCQQNEATT